MSNAALDSESAFCFLYWLHSLQGKCVIRNEMRNEILVVYSKNKLK